jgi:Tfp pilus assembly protein PilX
MYWQSGSVLITLLIFVVVSLIIVSAAVLLVVDSTVITTNQQVGTTAVSIAESGAENAMLRLLRNPSYTGEVLTVGSGTATITVTGSAPITIRSIGRISDFERTVEVTAIRQSGVLTVTSWKEVE